MKCPACKETNLLLSERKGIEIDYCPDCRGVWLDRGELDKIIEKSIPDQMSSTPVGTGHREQLHRGYEKQHKRRKSFLEELFD